VTPLEGEPSVLFGKGWADVTELLSVGCSRPAVVLAGGGEGEGSVRAAADDVSVGVVLAVVLPGEHGAELEAAAFGEVFLRRQGQRWGPVSRPRMVLGKGGIVGHALEDGNPN
jgi:hypothetical protein